MIVYGIGLAAMVLGMAWVASRIPEDLSDELEPEERAAYRKYRSKRR